VRVAIAIWAAVLCAGIWPTAAAAQSDGPDVSGGARAEEIDRVVKQLGADRFRDREAASQRLEEMGVAAMEHLLRYSDHDDPEVAARVRRLLERFAWATHGALVVAVDADKPARKLGFRCGDVVLRINESDVTSNRQIGSIPSTTNRRYQLWRDGRIVTVEVPMAGIIGIRLSNWDLNKGGQAQAAGTVAWAEGRYDQAFRHLLAARKAGMDDLFSTERLIAAAEYNLDHALAMKIYDEMLPRTDAARFAWVHRDPMATFDGMPFSSARTAALLRELSEPGDDVFRTLSSAVDYFAGPGRNYPLAVKLTGVTWPEGTPAEHAFWRWYVRGRLGFFQRRYDQVLKGSPHLTGPRGWAVWEAVMAAIDAGKMPEAAALSAVVVSSFRSNNVTGYVAAHAMTAWSAAVAAGDEGAAKAIVDAVRPLEPEKACTLFTEDVRYQLSHMAINRRAAEWAKQMIPHAPEASRGRVVYTYLDTLRFTPDLTIEEWREAWETYAAGSDLGMDRYVHWLNAECLLRLGEYDQAEEEVKKFYEKYGGLEAFHRALKFLRANRQKLEGDWACLRGVTQVYDGRAKGSFWAVRYDGRTFHVDPDGRIRELPGLAPGEIHRPICGDSILVQPNGIIYSRRSQIYLLDEEAGRWVPTFASPNRVGGYEDKLTGPTGPVVLRYALKEYPAHGPGREIMRRIPLYGGWLAYEFNGDLTIAVHPETLKLIDLSREIGRLAGKDAPAAIYWLQHKDHPGATMIPTDCGLWRMDAEGKLSRWAMPLKDPNVMVSILNWPKREGKYYVGVAPQQGGQIFELDIPTGKMTLTAGFNGLGPDDSYHWFMDDRREKRFVPCEYAVQRLYEKRLGAPRSPDARKEE